MLKRIVHHLIIITTNNIVIIYLIKKYVNCQIQKKLNPFAANESCGNFPRGKRQTSRHFRQRRAIHQAGDVIACFKENTSETAD